MNTLITNTQTPLARDNEERVISLYEICKVLNKRHSDAMKVVPELHATVGFGEVRNFRTSNSNNVSIQTYSYTRNQALAVGARLDNRNIILLVQKLEELNKPMTLEQIMKKAIMMADERIAELENKITEDKPLTDFGRAISQSTATVKIGDWIKAINDSGDISMGRNKAFKWFRSNGFLQKDNMPYQRYVDSGLFEVKEGLVVTDTKQIPTFTTLLTAKGQMYFAKRLKEETQCIPSNLS